MDLRNIENMDQEESEERSSKVIEKNKSEHQPSVVRQRKAKLFTK